MKGAIYHEIGHNMDYMLKLSENEDIRKIYDDWVKKLVESDAYYISPTSNEGEYLNTLGYIKFECSDLDDTNNSRSSKKWSIDMYQKEYVQLN